MVLFSDPCMPRVLTRITPQKLELCTILMKERRKRVRHLGSMWHHYGDRHHIYSQRGGLNGSKFILQKTTSRHQYYHPGMYSRLGDKQWSIRQIKVKGTQYDLPGGFTRTRWDQQICPTTSTHDSFKRYFRGIGQDEAIEFLEQWGVKYSVMDELRSPSVVECMYWKHKLYAHNFPYIADPVTNARKGDADYSWKGTEKIDYSVYGASSKDSKNTFASLWRQVVEEQKEAVKETPIMPPRDTPKPAATETVKEAPKPVAKEAPKPAAKEAPKPAAKEAPKEAAKEAPKEAPKPAAKEAPKEAPKPAAKEAPKEAPKPAAKEAAAKETPKAAEQAKTTPTAADAKPSQP